MAAGVSVGSRRKNSHTGNVGADGASDDRREEGGFIMMKTGEKEPATREQLVVLDRLSPGETGDVDSLQIRENGRDKSRKQPTEKITAWIICR